jgi:hypothetical protein
MSQNEQRLSDLLDRLERVVTHLEAFVKHNKRSMWLFDVFAVAFGVTCILFVLAGFLAPLFFVIRTLPGG